MAEVIELEELRRIGRDADQGSLLSRVDGIERRFALVEERQADLELRVRALQDDVALIDRKLDTVTALVRDDVARLEARMEARFTEVLAAIADLKRPG